MLEGGNPYSCLELSFDTLITRVVTRKLSKGTKFMIRLTNVVTTIIYLSMFCQKRYY